jgi:predicted DsbA family dithiol-disulfide isomerase
MAPAPDAIAIDVIIDVVCPWCFIGKRRLEKAMAAMAGTPLSVRWWPFQLDPTIPPQGMPREEYLRRKFGTRQMAQIFEPLIAAGAMEGIDFRFDLIARSPNTLDAHRLIRWAHRQNQQEPLVERLLQLYFLEGADIGNQEILGQAAADIGLDSKAAAQLLAGDDGRAEVQHDLERAARLGVTGVPTFIVANRYAVIGAHEPRYIAGAIAKARADAAHQPRA